MIDLCLANCKIPSKHDNYYIGVDEGKIVEIKKSPMTAEKTIDLHDKIILPGLIDAHVHFRDPGLTYKEDFKTGSQAAANGGFTTVLDMPNTVPPTNTVKAFKEKLDIASKKSVVDFGLHAGVSDLEEIEKIADLKPASFKIFMDLFENSFLVDVFKRFANLPHQYTISLHCEDKHITKHCSEELKNENDPKIYANARPPIAEVVSISAAIALSEYYDQKIHICHVSTKKSLELIHQARINDYPVSCEITPHHLFLSDSYFDNCGNFVKTNPPLRDINNRLDLRYLNKIDIIGTDHAPHSMEEKNKDLWEAPSGIPNLETTLPLLLNQINNGQMSFQDIIWLLCEKPSQIFNLAHKGRISVGMDADFVVLDMDKEWTIKPENFYSKAEYTPFEGFEVKGMPIMTIVRGNVVMEDNIVFKNQGHCVFD
ncbi:dihydroorotase [Methanobacterium alcaliphilum]|uniref:dihydroorotase n=1 Tax=Methanobacterium alcaliphilum TaxID=392018 RepID=UPI00200B63B6|nr:dihydroorotase family protein [Methanobacterium alcaliphilum]MCK9150581.1 dihydroorotase family protein [Methanobacterium alcaliphilum]